MPSRGFLQVAGNIGNGFGIIELEPARAALGSELSGQKEHQFFLFAAGEVHEWPFGFQTALG